MASATIKASVSVDVTSASGQTIPVKVTLIKNTSHDGSLPDWSLDRIDSKAMKTIHADLEAFVLEAARKAL